MYKVRLKAVTPNPVELPRVIEVLSESLRSSNCIVVEKPSWILASCGGSVMVKVYIEMGKRVGELLGFEGVSIVELESLNAPDVVKLTSVIVAVLERAGIGILMESS